MFSPQLRNSKNTHDNLAYFDRAHGLALICSLLVPTAQTRCPELRRTLLATMGRFLLRGGYTLIGLHSPGSNFSDVHCRFQLVPLSDPSYMACVRRGWGMGIGGSQPHIYFFISAQPTQTNSIGNVEGLFQSMRHM